MKDSYWRLQLFWLEILRSTEDVGLQKKMMRRLMETLRAKGRKVRPRMTIDQSFEFDDKFEPVGHHSSILKEKTSLSIIKRLMG